MTQLLERAFAEAAKLPEQEQDSLAAWLLEMLESDRRWDELFAKSEDALAKLADEALADFEAGRTEELNIDKL
jgi:hypothetical protein